MNITEQIDSLVGHTKRAAQHHGQASAMVPLPQGTYLTVTVNQAGITHHLTHEGENYTLATSLPGQNSTESDANNSQVSADGSDIPEPLNGSTRDGAHG